MESLHASIKLRPTRIGFLVNPRDIVSVKRIMRICTCLWGGALNPIIPVFQRPPKDWAYDQYEQRRGYDVARGYIEFFEPDVYVEAEEGMLEKVGLEHLRKPAVDSRVLDLDEFFSSDWRRFRDVSFGLNVLDIMRHRYQAEQKFLLKDELKSIFMDATRRDAASEAIFGCYPEGQELRYFQQNFEDVFKPKKISTFIEGWSAVFESNANTPLRITREGISFNRTWQDDLVIYIFDPRKSTDLIDFWNLRIESKPVLPVPIEWAKELSSTLANIIEAENRPVRGNSNGLMHHATVEFSRSIDEKAAESMIESLFTPSVSKLLSVKLWRNRIWQRKRENEGSHLERMAYTFKKSSHKLNVDDDGPAEIEALSPDFADQYGGHNARWVNIVSIGTYGDSQWALFLPFNTFNRNWPWFSYSDQLTITNEGWGFLRKYKNMSLTIRLATGDSAIIDWLGTKDVKAQLSEPGRIAKQVIACLGNIRDLHILQNPETLKLLNDMARPVRRRSNNLEIVEETFEDRSCHVKVWTDHISKRRDLNAFPRISVEDFANRKILKIGVETKCQHCQQTNWKGLDAIDYLVNCERCLNSYPFPQSKLQKNNRNWKYRVIGPFSIHDYSRGSYSALLTLKALNDIRYEHHAITYSTALDLEFDGQKAEIDFAAWLGPDSAWWALKNPEFFIGEAKSFSTQAIKKNDIDKLKQVASKLPQAGIVVSVLKDEFSLAEKKLLTSLVNWSRRRDLSNGTRRPILLLTGVELFADFSIEKEWKKRGNPYVDHANHQTTKSIMELAEATQIIHLNLPLYWEWLGERQS